MIMMTSNERIRYGRLKLNLTPNNAEWYNTLIHKYAGKLTTDMQKRALARRLSADLHQFVTLSRPYHANRITRPIERWLATKPKKDDLAGLLDEFSKLAKYAKKLTL